MIKRICQTCGYVEFVKEGVPTLNEDGTESYNTEYITLNECMKCCGNVPEETTKIPSVEEGIKEDTKDDKVEESVKVEEKEPDIKIEGIKTAEEAVGDVQELPVGQAQPGESSGATNTPASEEVPGEPGTPKPTETRGSEDTSGPKPAIANTTTETPNTSKDRKSGAGS